MQKLESTRGGQRQRRLRLHSAATAVATVALACTGTGSATRTTDAEDALPDAAATASEGVVVDGSPSADASIEASAAAPDGAAPVRWDAAPTASADAGAGGGSSVVCVAHSAILCRMVEPDCGPGRVPSVEGSCWGPCVDITACACESAADCPDANQYTCWMSTGRCNFWGP